MSTYFVSQLQLLRWETAGLPARDDSAAPPTRDMRAAVHLVGAPASAAPVLLLVCGKRDWHLRSRGRESQGPRPAVLRLHLPERVHERSCSSVTGRLGTGRRPLTTLHQMFAGRTLRRASVIPRRTHGVASADPHRLSPRPIRRPVRRRSAESRTVTHLASLGQPVAGVISAGFLSSSFAALTMYAN